MNLFNLFERLFAARVCERELAIEREKVANLTLQLNSLTADKEQLQCEIKALEDIQNHHYTYEEKMGTWLDEASGLRYCAKCKPQNIMSPLQNNEFGWSCPVCGSKFKDPARPPPRPFIPS